MERAISFLFLSGVLLLFSFSVFAEHEKNPEKATLYATMLTTTAIQCAPSEKSERIFKPDQIVFTGFIDKHNIFKVYVTKENVWAAMLENTAELSCIYFTGQPGMLKKVEKQAY